MARDNEQICLLAFNVFGLICIFYSCLGINDLQKQFRNLDDVDKESCHPYIVWKMAFLIHIIFFFICLSFSVGTAQSYLNDDEAIRNAQFKLLRFEKMIENALDVVRVFCILFCGPFIMIECIITVIFYKRILHDCEKIPDAFTNILVYILIIMGCISLTMTAFCCYMTFLFGKTVKECLPQIRNPQTAVANESEESLNNSGVLSEGGRRRDRESQSSRRADGNNQQQLFDEDEDEDDDEERQTQRVRNRQPNYDNINDSYYDDSEEYDIEENEESEDDEDDENPSDQEYYDEEDEDQQSEEIEDRYQSSHPQLRGAQNSNYTLDQESDDEIIDTRQFSTYPLPGEILSDLQDAFKFYDKEDSGYITITHFRNILHNFGFNKMTKKEIDDELKKNDIDPNKRTQVDFNQNDFDSVRLAVSYRWNKGGREEEARDCFRLFDKRDKSYITSNDLKQVLPNYLEFPVTDAEIQELIAECDPNQTGNIAFRDFARLYNA